MGGSRLGRVLLALAAAVLLMGLAAAQRRGGGGAGGGCTGPNCFPSVGAGRAAGISNVRSNGDRFSSNQFVNSGNRFTANSGSQGRFAGNTGIQTRSVGGETDVRNRVVQRNPGLAGTNPTVSANTKAQSAITLPTTKIPASNAGTNTRSNDRRNGNRAVVPATVGAATAAGAAGAVVAGNRDTRRNGNPGTNVNTNTGVNGVSAIPVRNGRQFQPDSTYRTRLNQNTQASAAVALFRNPRPQQSFTPSGTYGSQVYSSLNRRDYRSAVNTIYTGVNSGRVTEVASGVIGALTVNTNINIRTSTIYALGDFGGRYPQRAPQFYAQCASYAVQRGYGREYARYFAGTFSYCRRYNYLPNFCNSFSQAIIIGGNDALATYGLCISDAITLGGDDYDALIDATAYAFCQSGEVVTSWANAYNVALRTNGNCCTVLEVARTRARSRCGGGIFNSYTSYPVFETVLGYCGLLTTTTTTSFLPSTSVIGQPFGILG